MTKKTILVLAVLANCCLASSNRCNAQVIWDRARLDSIRNGEFTRSTETKDALGRLRHLADEALQNGPRAVTDKKELPPSRDVHDYLSYSRYWWPDPSKADGLPYIRKDGIVNRKLISKGDRVRLGEFTEDVQALVLAGHLFKDARYSRHAAKMIRVWFLDSATKMNPNLNFGQGVPGRADGRGPGLIDTRSFMFVLDSVELLDSSVWSNEKQRALQAWFGDYVKWMQTSELGLHERAAKNNHGSWYDAQLARYALFAGNVDLAKTVVAAAKTKRIAKQFDATGNQPNELERTRSLHYSIFNLTALSNLARVGDQVGVDLWEFTPDHGFGMRKSMSGLLPYLSGETTWQHPQIEPYTLSRSAHMTLRLFANHFNDPNFTQDVAKSDLRHPELDFTVLLVGGD